MGTLRILAAWPIRKKLLLLLLVIFLPAFGIIIASGLDQRRHEIIAAENNGLLLAQSLAAQQEQVAIGTKQMLSTLAQLPEVQRLDANACNELFTELHSRYPFYSIIGAVTPDGNMFAASSPFEPGSVNLSDGKPVRDAIRTLDFSAGGYMIGRVSKVQSINYGYPVFDADRNLIAVIIAGFKLDEYARFVKKVKLPVNSRLTIADYNGVCLYRFPENDTNAVGKPAHGDILEQISNDSEHGIFERAGEDSIRRIYAYKQLRLMENSPPYLYVIVSIDKDKIIDKANIEMLGSLSVLGVASIVAMALAWVFGNLAFVEPMRQLVAATQRFGSGEMGTRTDLPHTPDEVGRLAKSFDDMATTLEMRNIERQEAELALRESEEKYRRLIETTDTGYVIIDQEGRVTDANAEYVRLSGHAAIQEILGRRVVEWTAAHDLERNAEEVMKCVEKGATRNLEIDYVNQSGDITPLEINATLIRTAKGPIILALCRDISRRKRAREALRYSEQRFGALSEASFEGIAITQGGIIIDANSQLALMSGYDLPEIIGKPVKEMLVSADQESVLQDIGCGHEKPCENRLLCKDGSTLCVEMQAKHFKYRGNTALVMAVRDISERKRMQDELIRAKKLEATGILAGGIAHDFNNLLAAILGNIDMAKDEVEPGTCALDLLDEAETAALRASNLTKKFITFSTGGEPLKSSTLAQEFIMGSAALALDYSEVQPRYTFSRDLWAVEVDRGQMSQVIYNVISNAKDAMPQGGVIDILARNVEIGSEITGLPLKEGRYVSIMLKDYGTGIPRDNLGKIFDPYFSTKDRGSQKGMGMGLTIAHSIVRKHGGHITVESEIGTGTTVCIYLPAAVDRGQIS